MSDTINSLTAKMRSVCVNRFNAALHDIDLLSASCLLRGIAAIDEGDLDAVYEAFEYWSPELLTTAPSDT